LKMPRAGLSQAPAQHRFEPSCDKAVNAAQRTRSLELEEQSLLSPLLSSRSCRGSPIRRFKYQLGVGEQKAIEWFSLRRISGAKYRDWVRIVEKGCGMLMLIRVEAAPIFCHRKPPMARKERDIDGYAHGLLCLIGRSAPSYNGKGMIRYASSCSHAHCWMVFQQEQNGSRKA